ncbi:hypothetical protein [Fischerella thermalis]|uniref:hypothetical protein n=1 Tax=Fischerella thermalis TaxID=372787 RepID=UPI0002D4D650|nr:hypothetical protein [Fischerella thermalis]
MEFLAFVTAQIRRSLKGIYDQSDRFLTREIFSKSFPTNNNKQEGKWKQQKP